MHQSDRKRFIDPKRGGVIHSYATQQDMVLRVAAWCESFACAIERTGVRDGDLIRFTERQTREASELPQEWLMVVAGLGSIIGIGSNEPDNPEAVALQACANSMTFLIVGTPERAFPLTIPADTPERYRAGARELRARAECFDDPEPAMAESEPKAVEDAPVDDGQSRHIVLTQDETDVLETFSEQPNRAAFKHELIQWSGRSRRAVDRAIDRFIELGFVEAKPRGKGFGITVEGLSHLRTQSALRRQ